MNGENDKLSKIKKSSNTALIITQITEGLCIASASICVVTGILLIALHDWISNRLGGLVVGFSGEELLHEIHNDYGTLLAWLFERVGIEEALGRYIIAAGMNIIVAGAEIVILAIIMHFVGKIFTEIRDEDSPFRKTVLRNMRIPFVLITLVILRNDILIGVVTGFALYCVYEVFEYGAELQRLSDETL